MHRLEYTMFQPQPVQPREWVYMYVTANGEKRVHPVTQQPNEVYKNKNKVSLAKTKALLKTRTTQKAKAMPTFTPEKCAYVCISS